MQIIITELHNLVGILMLWAFEGEKPYTIILYISRSPKSPGVHSGPLCRGLTYVEMLIFKEM